MAPTALVTDTQKEKLLKMDLYGNLRKLKIHIIQKES